MKTTGWTRLVLIPIACALISMCSTALGKARVPARASVGAIRWDGWFAGNKWQRNLDPQQWHYRLPFYGKVISEDKVEVCGDSQAVMDREIGYASQAGLDYWAFCYYHPSSFAEADRYNYGWKLYLSSKRRSEMHFCLLLQGAHLGPAAEWPETVKQFVKLFREPSYQKVCGDRPLVYCFATEGAEQRFGSVEAARNAFDQLREESVKAGAGMPYIVAQVWDAKAGAKLIEQYGLDALGAYSGHGGQTEHKEYPFKVLAENNASLWKRLAETGRKVVPLVNAGWDGRPRQYGGPWFAAPRPPELADSLRMALSWAKENKLAAEANTILVYAWNETDEGGWLVPTRSEGRARVEALAKVLRR